MTIGVLANPLNTNVETYLSYATSAATELEKNLLLQKLATTAKSTRA